MNLIIPMAGRGSRLRPHTLTVPKPLVPVAGKPIVQRLVEDLSKMCRQQVKNIGFIIGDFGPEVEAQLLEVASKLKAKGHIFHQDKPLGTAHAILCAEPLLEGNTIVAFADTLFKADFRIDSDKEGIIWVHKVADPSAFGVVQLDESGVITEFVEKPAEFVSDLAIIGIYYFKDGEKLKEEIKYVIDNDIKDKGEYQLTTALENLKQRGTKFVTGTVDEWLDCGNKEAVVYTNQRILEFNKNGALIDATAKLENTTLIPPCYIGPNVVLTNSVIGPYVSIGEGSSITDAVVSNTVIQTQSNIQNAVLQNSMIGNFVTLSGNKSSLSIGDFTIM